MWLYFSVSVYNLHIFSHSEFNFWIIFQRECLDRVKWEAEATIQIKNYFGLKYVCFSEQMFISNYPENGLKSTFQSQCSK